MKPRTLERGRARILSYRIQKLLDEDIKETSTNLTDKICSICSPNIFSKNAFETRQIRNRIIIMSNYSIVNIYILEYDKSYKPSAPRCMYNVIIIYQVVILYRQPQYKLDKDEIDDPSPLDTVRDEKL